MRRTIVATPRNSLILVMDRTIGVIPDAMGGGLVAATSSCVAVGTLSEYDGETSISLSDEGKALGFDSTPVFDGMLETPSKVLSICTVLNDVLLELGVPSEKTRVRIWANDVSEPDNIVVVV